MVKISRTSELVGEVVVLVLALLEEAVVLFVDLVIEVVVVVSSTTMVTNMTPSATAPPTACHLLNSHLPSPPEIN